MENENIKNILIELARWVKLLAYDKVKGVLSDTLQTEKEKLIYHLSDGRSSIEIAKIVGLKSHASILEYWKRWNRLGLMYSVPARGGKRYVKVFNLEDFGIEVPKIENDKN